MKTRLHLRAAALADPDPLADCPPIEPPTHTR
jgi:hypothetical protein